MTTPTASPTATTTAGPAGPAAPAGPPGPGAPAVRSQEVRRQRLRTMKRRATALLGAVTLLFLAITIWGGDSSWAAYVQAGSEAAMVGALADWFAVTALFRHPLGLPIPHTAIVVERKDQFAATLGEFIQETFLTPALIVTRVRSANVVPRVADWLCDPAHASRVAAEVLDGAVRVADMLKDDDVHRMIERVARERVEAVPLAPLAGRTLQFVIQDGRHQQALDAGLRELDRYLDENREQLRGRVARESPWWLPGAAEDKIFERLIDGARRVLGDMIEDRGHHLRQHLEQRLVKLAEDLQTSPAYLERGEKLKADLLSHPQVREWVQTIWRDAKEHLRTQASNPDSELRTRLANMIMAAGRRLEDDPALASKLEDSIETAVAYVVERFHGEIVDLVSGTIARWDAEETADRLELLLGPDLQYIRINGTVVGAGVGLLLHAIADLAR